MGSVSISLCRPTDPPPLFRVRQTVLQEGSRPPQRYTLTPTNIGLHMSTMHWTACSSSLDSTFTWSCVAARSECAGTCDHAESGYGACCSECHDRGQGPTLRQIPEDGSSGEECRMLTTLWIPLVWAAYWHTHCVTNGYNTCSSKQKQMMIKGASWCRSVLSNVSPVAGRSSYGDSE